MLQCIAIVGPGRVGRALASAMAQSGLQVLGLVGRSARLVELGPADCVVFCVGDADLAAAIQANAPAARSEALWLHTSGCHGLSVFGSLAVRRAVLHPAMPFLHELANCVQGAPAVLQSEAAARADLLELVARLGMVPLWRQGGNDAAYHAGCVLAANAVTALLDAAERLLHEAGGLSPDAARTLAQALAQSALAACAQQGPVAALTGPVRRGDATTVAAQLQALRAVDHDLAAAFAAAMRSTLLTAERAGLPTARAALLRTLLREASP